MSEAPFTACTFAVEVRLPGRDEPLCEAAFCACDGLALRRATTSYREGGAAGVRLVAAGESVANVTLRRGMTAPLDLWDWWERVRRDPRLRATCDVVVLSPDLERVRVRFRLYGCLPVKLEAPSLNASANEVAIETLELACEAIELVRPDAPGAPPPECVEPARVQLREIGEQRRLIAQFNPEQLRTSVRHEDGPRARLDVTLCFDVEAPLPPGCDAEGDVRRMTEHASYLATPRRGRDGALSLPDVRLSWGTFAFDGRVEMLEERFERFAADGSPLRSTLALTLVTPPAA